MSDITSSDTTELPYEVQVKVCSSVCKKTVTHYRDHNMKVCAALDRERINYTFATEAIEKLEKQIKAYIKNEEQYEYDLKYARWERDCKSDEVEELKSELLKVRAEKDQMKLDIGKLENASKSVQNVIQAQIHDKLKNGIGYHNVPPPYNDNYLPSYTNIIDKLKEKVKDNPIMTIMTEGEISTKVDGVVEDWVSDSDEESKKEKEIEVKSIVKSKKAESKVKPTEQSIAKTSCSKPVAEPATNSKGCNQCSNCSQKFQPTAKIRGNQRNWNQKMSQNYDIYLKKAKHCFICGKVNHLAKYCFHNPLHRRNKSRNRSKDENCDDHGKSYRKDKDKRTNQKPVVENHQKEDESKRTEVLKRRWERIVKTTKRVWKPKAVSAQKNRSIEKTADEEKSNSIMFSSNCLKLQILKRNELNNNLNFDDTQGKPKTSNAWVVHSS